MAEREEIRRLDQKIATLKSQLQKLEMLRKLLLDVEVMAAIGEGSGATEASPMAEPSPVEVPNWNHGKPAPTARPKPVGKTAYQQMRHILGERGNEPISFTELRRQGVKEASARSTVYKSRAEAFVLTKGFDDEGRTGIQLTDEEYANWRAEMESRK